MQALYVLCLCGISVTCKEPHKVDYIFYAMWLFSSYRYDENAPQDAQAQLHLKCSKGGDMMGQKDDVLTDDFRKVTMKLL